MATCIKDVLNPANSLNGLTDLILLYLSSMVTFYRIQFKCRSIRFCSLSDLSALTYSCNKVLVKCLYRLYKPYVCINLGVGSFSPGYLYFSILKHLSNTSAKVAKDCGMQI